VKDPAVFAKRINEFAGAGVSLAVTVPRLLPRPVLRERVGVRVFSFAADEKRPLSRSTGEGVSTRHAKTSLTSVAGRARGYCIAGQLGTIARVWEAPVLNYLLSINGTQRGRSVRSSCPAQGLRPETLVWAEGMAQVGAGRPGGRAPADRGQTAGGRQPAYAAPQYSAPGQPYGGPVQLREPRRLSPGQNRAKRNSSRGCVASFWARLECTSSFSVATLRRDHAGVVAALHRFSDHAHHWPDRRGSCT